MLVFCPQHQSCAREQKRREKILICQCWYVCVCVDMKIQAKWCDNSCYSRKGGAKINDELSMIDDLTAIVESRASDPIWLPSGPEGTFLKPSRYFCRRLWHEVSPMIIDWVILTRWIIMLRDRLRGQRIIRTRATISICFSLIDAPITKPCRLLDPFLGDRRRRCTMM